MTLPLFTLVRSKTDLNFFKDMVKDSIGLRLSVLSPHSLVEQANRMKPGGVWLDCSLDFVDKLSKMDDDRRCLFTETLQGNILSNQLDIHLKKNLQPVQSAVEALLNYAYDQKPAFVSLPQYPYNKKSGVFRANETLVTCAKENSSRHSSFILPIVLQDRQWTDSKPRRDELVKRIEGYCEIVKPELLWVVDSSLDDDMSIGTLAKRRFPNLISLHRTLKAKIPNLKVIAGPYWGMGLVLFARGLAENLLITLASGFQYFGEGGLGHFKAATKIAFPPLRRLVKKSPELRKWLKDVVANEYLPEAARESFHQLLVRFDQLEDEAAKRQVGEFYTSWIKKITALPPAGRAFGLYQDLSTAYALGSGLPSIPDEKGPGKNPAHVAENLMLNVLNR